MLSLAGCRKRLSRLKSALSRQGVDHALIANPKSVYYFTGVLPSWTSHSVLAVAPKREILVAAQEPAEAAVTEVRTYTAQELGTLRLDQTAVIASELKDIFCGAGRCAAEFSFCDAHLCQLLGDSPKDIDADVYRLKRSKDEDELALLRKSAECVDACYRRAREIIGPGVCEVDLYSELLAVAVRQAGEPIGRFGNDFQCGTPGGPPRPRAARSGELWILDVAVEYRGYNADACRVFAVDSVDDAQLAAWQVLRDTLKHVEAQAKPGVRCADLYGEAKRRLDGFMPNAFFHHLGHGIGLQAHEAPRLNPAWDDVLEPGDTFTLEPGLYHESLRGGLRLENDYHLTEAGVDCLTSFPLEL